MHDPYKNAPQHRPMPHPGTGCSTPEYSKVVHATLELALETAKRDIAHWEGYQAIVRSPSDYVIKCAPATGKPHVEEYLERTGGTLVAERINGEWVEL